MASVTYDTFKTSKALAPEVDHARQRRSVLRGRMRALRSFPWSRGICLTPSSLVDWFNSVDSTSDTLNHIMFMPMLCEYVKRLDEWEVSPGAKPGFLDHKHINKYWRVLGMEMSEGYPSWSSLPTESVGYFSTIIMRYKLLDVFADVLNLESGVNLPSCEQSPIDWNLSPDKLRMIMKRLGDWTRCVHNAVRLYDIQPSSSSSVASGAVNRILPTLHSAKLDLPLVPESELHYSPASLPVVEPSRDIVVWTEKAVVKYNACTLTKVRSRGSMIQRHQIVQNIEMAAWVINSYCLVRNI
ncbi:hypothetical protein JAAARDRAFT_520877 [Jaapia argillacea MUCL 33604]|uniref:Uncharacterized protein n=1 Tax=Jaapia argillacea MUCL 33604 TaxID=933084 RepID=A0A067QGL5_9AGAM|nr:hypothetical protein JAAARDRAFT_520877 [Jaapia argillacea MUCL 33604]